MRVWRICKNKYEDTAFEGIGSKQAGGRWNSKGVAVVYTSESLALAALEHLVHLNVDEEPPALIAVWADVPDEFVGKSYDVEDLPENWQRVTGNSTLVACGDQWQQSNASVGLKVPSVVVPEDKNVLLNPNHPNFSSVEIGTARSLSFDGRLFAV